LQLAWLKSEIVEATADVKNIDDGKLNIFSAHETKQGHLVIVFSNGVRVTFYIAPSRTTVRCYKEEDFSIVKIEASPMEACIEMMKKTKWHPLMVS
jgi:hypothetical protein